MAIAVCDSEMRKTMKNGTRKRTNSQPKGMMMTSRLKMPFTKRVMIFNPSSRTPASPSNEIQTSSS